MKSYVILMVTLTMLIKPLWPVAEYIMNYDYIVNVLCENKEKPELQCDGKCYLAQMLAEESEQNQNNPFDENKSKTQVFQIMEDIPTYTENLTNSRILNSRKNTNFLQNLHSLLLVFEVVQPPEIN